MGRAESRAAGCRDPSPGGLAPVGLADCATAVNARAVVQLIRSGDDLLPGYACGRCGLLGTAADGCADWEVAAQPVPDLIDEMVHRTLDDGGQVTAVRSARSRIAARLRFRLPGTGGAQGQMRPLWQ